MIRSRKRWLWLAVAAALVSAATASAVVLHGRGELTAVGNGAAVLVLRGQATVRGIGLAVVEEDAVVEVRGDGVATDLGDGRTLYEGFGQLTVRSLAERTRLEVAGARLRIHARGVGVAILKGVGRVSTNDVDAPWAPDVEIEFDSAE